MLDRSLISVTWLDAGSTDRVALAQVKRADQKVAVSRIGFIDEALVGKRHDPVQYLDLVVTLDSFTNSSANLDLKGLLEHILVPIEIRVRA